MTLLPFIIACFACQNAVAQADSTHLGEVIVTGTRVKSDAREITATVSVVDSALLNQSGRANFLPTLAELVPGMFVTSRGVMGYGVSSGSAGGITVRGMSSNSGQVMVMIDGHPQYSGIYGHTLADAYQTILAGRVEVVRGPASVLYGGNAMGGVLNIVTHSDGHGGEQPPPGCRSTGTLGVSGGSYGSLQADLGGRFGKGKLSAMVTAQYQRSDNHREDMDFEQATLFAKIGCRFNSHWNLWGGLDVTHWNAANPGPAFEPLDECLQHITRGAATVSLDNHYARHSGSLNAYTNWGRHTINDGFQEQGGVPQTELFQSMDALTGVSMWEDFRLFRGNNLTVGFDYQRIYGHAWFTSVAADTVVTANGRGMQSACRGMNQWAAYIDTRQQLAKRWTLSAGLRYDYHSVSGREWVPQAGLAWRPLSGGSLKATFGKGFRTPSLKEMYLYGSRNEALRPERLLNYELAWLHSLYDCGVSYGVNVYYMRADNIIVVLNGKNANSGLVRNCGLEAEATWRPNSHWRLNTNHSIIRLDRALPCTPTYKGNIGAQAVYGPCTFRVHLQQLCGLRAVAYGANAAADASSHNVTLLDAGMSYLLPGNVTLWVRGENLLARRYEFVRGYPMPRATFMAGFRVRF